MNYPRLELTFEPEGERRFLHEAVFTSRDGKAHRNLTVTPPRGKLLRSLCILLLLAKYRGVDFAEENVIWFRSKTDKLNWIKALSGALPKAEKPVKGKAFFEHYFDGLKFINVSRGNTSESGALPFANYLTNILPLQNVELSTWKKGGKRALVGDKLAKMAKRLELFEIGKSKKWKPCVATIVKETKSDRLKLRTPPSSSPDHPQPFIVSTLWKELFHRVLNEMQGRDLNGNWYAICLNPRWLTDWKEVFFAAAKNHHAAIKVAFHSPDASETSAAIKAQWDMNSSKVRDESTKIEKSVSAEIRRSLEEMRLWMSELDKPRKNSFAFYQSNVVLPFAGLLYVPRDAKRLSKLKPVAPTGTWCVLMLYPFYQIDYQTRCAIYFNTASPMLDIYYNSILDFFEAGQEREYIVRLDSLDTPLKKASGKERQRK